MGDLVGDAPFQQYGLTFPVLFKVIDANSDLAIQVHPDDEVAFEKHNSYGKTELWYVIDAQPGAELILGFNGEVSREQYQEAIANDRIEELHRRVPVKKGDVFFIPAGTVHGCPLYTSDAADDLTCVDLGGRRVIIKKRCSASPSHTFP